MRELKRWPRVIAVLIALACIVPDSLSADKGSKEIDLYIWAGQSNAQGWKGNAEQYPNDPKKLDRKIKFYYVFPAGKNNFSSDGKWIAMGPQKGRFPKGHFGPEVSFARLLVAEGRQVAVFKYSKGATGLGRHWRNPGGKGLYDGMVNEYKKAVKLLKAQGYKVKPRAFIWIQGESDSSNKGLASAYKGRLETMIKDLRKNVTGNKNLRIILGVDEENPSVKRLPIVLKTQQAFAKKDKFAAHSSMRGLAKADKTHLKPKALVEHGERVYKAYKTVAGKDFSPISESAGETELEEYTTEDAAEEEATEEVVPTEEAATSTSSGGVTISKSGKGYTVSGKNYQATVTANGWMNSLKINGKEFLAANVAKSKGSYFWVGRGPAPMPDITLEGNTLHTSGPQCAVSYHFSESEVKLDLNNKTGKVVKFFIILHAEAKKAGHKGGKIDKKNVPESQWVRKDATLTISACDRIWPFKGGTHVYEQAMKSKGKRSITLSFSSGVPENEGAGGDEADDEGGDTTESGDDI